MNYPTLSRSDLLERLAPTAGRIPVVLDTDTYNEVDDQFALAYALRSPERLDLQAVYAAPFSSGFFVDLLGIDPGRFPMTADPAEGMELSYREAKKVFDLLGTDPANRVFRGSDRYLSGPDEPVESDAARDLVRRAMEVDGLLTVIAIGEITNVASAIMMEPRIIEKILVVWLAGHAPHWPQTLEFNLGQDPIASRLILDCGVPLVLVPCMGAASHLTTTAAELRERLDGRSRIGSYLTEIVTSQLDAQMSIRILNLLRRTYLRNVDDFRPETVDAFPTTSIACSRVIWDIAAVGYAVNPTWCPATLTSSPILTPDMSWRRDESRHPIRVVNFVHRDCVFGDMFDRLAEADAPFTT